MGSVSFAPVETVRKQPPSSVFNNSWHAFWGQGLQGIGFRVQDSGFRVLSS